MTEYAGESVELGAQELERLARPRPMQCTRAMPAVRADEIRTVFAGEECGSWVCVVFVVVAMACHILRSGIIMGATAEAIKKVRSDRDAARLEVSAREAERDAAAAAAAGAAAACEELKKNQLDDADRAEIADVMAGK